MKLYPQQIAPFLSIFVALNIGGCFTTSDELVSRPANSWTKQDCMTVLISAMAHNVHDHRSNIKVIVTPYVPRVMKAITRIQQLGDTTKLDTSFYGTQFDILLQASTGLLYDGESGLLFSKTHQRYYENITDLDSLLFLVSLSNNGWPCQSPIVVSPGGTRPLMLASDWPCYTPDIDDIQSRIVLINDREDTLRPTYIWGLKNTQLTTDETLFVMFQFVNGDKHFFEESTNMTIVLQSFTPSIGYKFKMSALME